MNSFKFNYKHHTLHSDWDTVRGARVREARVRGVRVRGVRIRGARVCGARVRGARVGGAWTRGFCGQRCGSAQRNGRWRGLHYDLKYGMKRNIDYDFFSQLNRKNKIS